MKKKLFWLVMARTATIATLIFIGMGKIDSAILVLLYSFYFEWIAEKQ